MRESEAKARQRVYGNVAGATKAYIPNRAMKGEERQRMGEENVDSEGEKNRGLEDDFPSFYRVTLPFSLDQGIDQLLLCIILK